MNRPSKKKRPATRRPPVVTPKVRAWVAEARIDRAGNECHPKNKDSLAVFAVSVHEGYPIGLEERFDLMEDVGKRFRDRVPEGAPSLWVFPGGYLGFDPTTKSWPGFDEAVVREALPAVLAFYPPGARLAFGADGAFEEGEQQVWICWRTPERAVDLHTISREKTDLVGRTLQVGPVRAAFFVGGEVPGSGASVSQLAGCRLLVDLAHSRVPGSASGAPGPRHVQQRQMLQFSEHGAAVLAHHHPGLRAAGRPRAGSQSDWIIFRGGRWLGEEKVSSLA